MLIAVLIHRLRLREITRERQNLDQVIATRAAAANALFGETGVSSVGVVMLPKDMRKMKLLIYDGAGGYAVLSDKKDAAGVEATTATALAALDGVTSITITASAPAASVMDATADASGHPIRPAASNSSFKRQSVGAALSHLTRRLSNLVTPSNPNLADSYLDSAPARASTQPTSATALSPHPNSIILDFEKATRVRSNSNHTITPTSPLPAHFHSLLSISRGRSQSTPTILNLSANATPYPYPPQQPLYGPRSASPVSPSVHDDDLDDMDDLDEKHTDDDFLSDSAFASDAATALHMHALLVSEELTQRRRRHTSHSARSLRSLRSVAGMRVSTGSPPIGGLLVTQPQAATLARSRRSLKSVEGKSVKSHKSLDRPRAAVTAPRPPSPPALTPPGDLSPAVVRDDDDEGDGTNVESDADGDPVTSSNLASPAVVETEEIEEPPICSICITPYTKNDRLRALPFCGHIFHSG
ncbi:hypothetical protein HK101_000605, partial [Irineochytrium annulatum]